MALKFVLESKLRARASVQLDIVVASHGHRLPVCGEGMVGDGVVEEVMDFWARHD